MIENIAMEPTTAMDRTGALKSDKLENLLCPVVSFTTRMLLQQCPAKLNEVQSGWYLRAQFVYRYLCVHEYVCGFVHIVRVCTHTCSRIFNLHITSPDVYFSDDLNEWID